MNSYALDEYQPLTRVALRHPRDAFRSQDFIDASWRALGYRAAPDYNRALAEFEAFAAILAEHGAAIEYLPSAPGLTLDAIYARDATVMTPDGAVSVRMGKSAREREPAVGDAAYRALGVAAPLGLAHGRLEGGDVVWFDAHTVAVGESYRTDPDGIAGLRALLPDNVELAVCPMPHFRGPGVVFHLMSLLSPLDRDLALAYPPLLPVRFQRWLAERGIELVDLPDSEFDVIGANVLALGPRKVLMLEGFPEARRRLERAGCEIVTYAGVEISRKGDGGPTCLTRPLERTPTGNLGVAPHLALFTKPVATAVSDGAIR